MSQLAEFNDRVLASGLLEASHTGLHFTWKSGEARNISFRIDRTLCTSDLINKIPALQTTVLPSSTSDHCPLLVQFNKESNSSEGKPFRYANN